MATKKKAFGRGKVMSRIIGPVPSGVMIEVTIFYKKATRAEIRAAYEAMRKWGRGNGVRATGRVGEPPQLVLAYFVVKNATQADRATRELESRARDVLD